MPFDAGTVQRRIGRDRNGEHHHVRLNEGGGLGKCGIAREGVVDVSWQDRAPDGARVRHTSRGVCHEFDALRPKTRHPRSRQQPCSLPREGTQKVAQVGGATAAHEGFRLLDDGHRLALFEGEHMRRLAAHIAAARHDDASCSGDTAGAREDVHRRRRRQGRILREARQERT